MELTATPFNTQSQSGELLPLYRDAYLRGDLARLSAQAVESYLHRDTGEAYAALTPGLAGAEALAIASTQQPQRFRRRALSFGAIGMMVAGAAMAANLPISSALIAKLPATTLSTLATDEGSSTQTVVLHGRIINEKGLPVVGATVWHKGTSSGTSTDNNGTYSLRVPATSQPTLQYSYGGHTYQDRKATVVAAVVSVVRPR